MIVVSAKDLTKAYGTDIILDRVSFHINKGDRVGIIGVNGIDRDFGFSVDSLEEAAVKRSICAASRRSFVLADYTKFNRRYMSKVFGIEDGAVRCLITDRQHENIDYGFLKHKVKLIFAD